MQYLSYTRNFRGLILHKKCQKMFRFGRGGRLWCGPPTQMVWTPIPQDMFSLRPLRKKHGVRRDGRLDADFFLENYAILRQLQSQPHAAWQFQSQIHNWSPIFSVYPLAMVIGKISLVQFALANNSTTISNARVSCWSLVKACQGQAWNPSFNRYSHVKYPSTNANIYNYMENWTWIPWYTHTTEIGPEVPWYRY